MSERTQFVTLTVSNNSEHGPNAGESVYLPTPSIGAMWHQKNRTDMPGAQGYTDITVVYTSDGAFRVLESCEQVMAKIAEAEGACVGCRELQAKIDTIAFHLGSKEGADVVGEAIEAIAAAKGGGDCDEEVGILQERLNGYRRKAAERAVIIEDLRARLERVAKGER